jgi:hypothetical protein
MAGFGFRECMRGSWARCDGERGGGRFEFTVAARSGPLTDFGKTRLATIDGTVDAEGLATGRPLTGTMELRPWLRRVIRYQFEFKGDDGLPYSFAGQKDIRWLDPVRTWTELPGQVSDGGGLIIGSALTRFDLKGQSLAFVRSFRVA